MFNKSELQAVIDALEEKGIAIKLEGNFLTNELICHIDTTEHDQRLLGDKFEEIKEVFNVNG